ncbi:MAG TPA: uroporphyrinogen-III synthase [Acidimicrobiales bacterium]
MASLDGFTIGITADRRWKEQADLFTRRGAAVLHGPTLATRFLSDDPDLRAATHALVERPPDLLIATTGVGIRAWLEAAQTWGIADELLAALGAARTVARGPKAANALAQAGLPVHMRAKSERMEEVAELLRSEPAASGRVALQRYGEDSLDAQAVLDARGADVVALSVYQWQLPADTGPARGLVQAACSGEVDVVTFTSAPAVVNLLGIAAEIGARRELLGAFAGGRVTAGCVGPVCAAAARDAGIADPIGPAVGRLGLLVRMVEDRLTA